MSKKTLHRLAVSLSIWQVQDLEIALTGDFPMKGEQWAPFWSTFRKDAQIVLFACVVSRFILGDSGTRC